MAMRGSERPKIENETDAKQGVGPRDNLKVLVASLVLLAFVAAGLFWYFDLLPGGSGLGGGAPK